MMRREIGWALAMVAGLAVGCASSSGPVAAPGAGSEVAAAEVVDPTVDCPPLTRVKYPFLTCIEDADGHVVFDAAPQAMTVSQMPPLDPFVESDEYWGN